jgi:hypothetical protein
VNQKKTLFMESTEVPAERTAAEISSLLIQAGATQIATEYANASIVGLRWSMKVSGRDLLFAMPARVEPVYRIFCKRKGLSPQTKIDYSTDIMKKAHRVAWRQLLRWTQAQLAMIECGMTEASEVFLPYWQANGTQSLFELFKGSEFKALGPGGPQ